MEASLIVRRDAEILFQSNGHWLQPLFELEDFLKKNDYEVSGLTIGDKIMGKAAAVLTCRLGFTDIYTGILSEPGLAFLQSRKINPRYDELVPRIQCQTETILCDIDNEEEVYSIIAKRAGR